MKIGLVCPYNMFRGGGVQECVRALQEDLVRRGHEAYIITPQPKDCPDEVPEGILFIGGSTDVKSFHTTAQISFSASTDALDELVREHDFDILHFHEPWVPFASRQLLRRSSSINIATFHAKLPDTAMNKTIKQAIVPYTRSVLKYLDVLTAVSDAAATYVSELTREPINIVPNGINLKKYTSVKRQKNAGKKMILYVGRLEKRKGVKYMLKSFKLLCERLDDVQLVIAGDGPDRQKLEQYVSAQAIPNVIFKGYVSEEDKLELFSKADLFCSPALYGESFGIVLLEAMAMGLPIVAGDNPGYSSVMQQRGKLSLVNPRYTDEFARRLETFLIDDELRDIWLDWAKKYVVQFDYKTVIDQYEALYKKALKARR